MLAMKNKPIAASLLTLGLLLTAGCQDEESRTLPTVDPQVIEAHNQAKNALMSAGAVKVERRPYPEGEGWFVDLSGVTPTDEIISNIGKLDYISEVILVKSDVTDDQLKALIAALPNQVLGRLDISNTQITDAGIEPLKNVQLLQEVIITRSKVTKAGAEAINAGRTPPAVIKQ